MDICNVQYDHQTGHRPLPLHNNNNEPISKKKYYLKKNKKIFKLFIIAHESIQSEANLTGIASHCFPVVVVTI